jgi:hypothetical protein
MNSSLDTAHVHLSVSDTVFITLGSARVHALAPINASHLFHPEYVVANCHKRKSNGHLSIYMALQWLEFIIFLFFF